MPIKAALALAFLGGTSLPAHAASYNYSDTNSAAIPDASTTCSSVVTRNFTVTDYFVVDDLDVGIVVDHPRRSDIFVYIDSPEGTTVQLTGDVGGGSDDLNMRLSDEAGSPIDFNNHNSAATYPEFELQPSNALSAFDGETATGTWTMRVCDDRSSQSGTYLQGHLEFTGTPIDPLEVTSTADTSTLGTLRYAITHANANPGDDNITFNIPTSDPNHSGGVWTISPTSPLAISDDGISIDASTQPGATCGGSVDGNGVLTDRTLAIEIDATNSAGDALRVESNAVTIRGFAIGLTANLSDSAINFDTGASGTVICNHLGTTADGLTARALEGYAIETGFSGNVADSVQIGDGTYAGRNVMANTRQAEVQCQDNGVTCDIRGNYIGVFADGFTPGTGISNNTVWIGGNNSVVGGPTAPERNIIGLSIDTGIAFSNGPSGVVVENNYIGVAADGVTMIDATLTGLIDGIEESDTVQTLTNLTIRDNVIGGFPSFGIDLNDATLSTATIAGNHIGVGSDGVTDVGYGLDGIALGGQTHTGLTIGGTGANDGNVIGFMSDNGIKITGTTGVTILGNHIGVGGDGSTDVGNGGQGIQGDGVSTVQIGNGAASGRNVISGNDSNGLSLTSATGVTIQGNYIGTIATGNTALANSFSGISIDDSTSVTVGGTATGAGNVISGNAAGSGMYIQGTSSGVTVEGNYIGVGADGTTALGNAHSGIWVDNTAAVIIGGSAAGAANILANNANDGVTVRNTATVAILANVITANGDIGIDLNSDSVTANDPGDGDSGPNELLNFPVLNGFVADGTVDVSYDIDLDVPAHAAGYRVDFFRDNTSGDTNGEGETHLGAVEPLAPGSGLTGSFTANAAVSPGDTISATVTRIVSGMTYDITSEFSVNATAGDPLVVTSTADSGAGSLRAAITYANANTGADAITFNIPGAASTVHTITLASALPSITDAGISIDGTTQSGASCGDLWAGTPHTLMIRVDSGSATDPTYNAITSNAANTAVTGLSITRFRRAVVADAASSNLSLQCSYTGLAPDGTAAGNFGFSVELAGSGARIGGLAAGEGNVISSNVAGVVTAAGSTDTAIRGNFIGTDPSGLAARPNTLRAINNLSGSATWRDITKNLLSGNTNLTTDSGVIHLEADDTITGSAGDVVISGNYFGVDRTGNTVLANGGDAIHFKGGSISGVTIGGITPADRNIIRGNNDGIDLRAVNDIAILGNHIGVGADGSTDIGPPSLNIWIDGTTNVDIGNGAAAGRNVLGNSGNNSIKIANASGVSVRGNYIGVAADGITAAPNPGHTVWVASGSGITIGGPNAGDGNIITNAGTNGVAVDGGTASAAILGNSIWNNTGLGIDLSANGVTANDSGDPDTGPNDLLNFPLINGFVADGTVDVSYDINLDVPAHAAGYRVDFFRDNTSGDTNGEGETHLGAVEPLAPGTDLTGSFTANAAVSPGDTISATVTRIVSGMTYDITSEFSLNATAGSPLVVTSTADSGAGSLRAAIAYANGNPGSTVEFDITGAGPHTITLASDLPAITASGTIIDGLTQTGATCGQLTTGTPHDLRIALSGNGGAVNVGLEVGAADNITIKGLGFGGFGDHAIRQLGNQTGTRIECNYIGVAPDGTTATPVSISDSSTVSVRFSGGTGLVIDNNLISGNTDDPLVDRGLYLYNVAGATITGNLIGLDETGMAALGNSQAGLSIEGTSSAITLGGTTPETRNIISGNGLHGVYLDTNASGVTLLGNYIGTARDGQADLGNGGAGLRIEGADTVTVGNGTSAGRNVISGNGGHGVNATNSASGLSFLGNYIGLAADGTSDLGNTSNGLLIDGSSGVTIGNGSAGGRNVISGNGDFGVALRSTSALTMRGTYIGTDATGQNAVQNNAYGIRLYSNQGGSPMTGLVFADNVISGNRQGGVDISSGSTTVLGVNVTASFTGNHIGVAADATTALGNAHHGLKNTSTPGVITLGGDAASDYNIIAHNTQQGVRITGNSGSMLAILGNSIYANNDLGIDLGTDGVTTNDGGDSDTGPNELLNFPVINQIIAYGITDFDYDLSLDVPANVPGYRVDFFLNTAADASGYGEGETHLGHVDVSGPGTHTGTLSGNASVSAGDIITATLTRKTGGTTYDITSEFSLAATALAPTDNGDAPGSYGNAAHRINPAIRLGASIDTDGGAQPSANADGDDTDGTDDEDGVTFPALAIGDSGTITVDVTGAGGYLQAWIDFDGSGSFDPHERIADDLADVNGDGSIPVPVSIPPNATTAQTFARFRWSTDFSIGVDGEAPDGEVEDYALTFTSAATTLAGTLIFDDGAGGGTAHDGVRTGAEQPAPIATVTVRATSGGAILATARPDASGAWNATLPFGFSGEVEVITSPAPGYLTISEGGVSGLPGLSNPSTEDGRIIFTPAPGSVTAGVTFGFVAEPRLAADQNATVLAGQVAVVSHTYTATSTASVTFALVDIAETVPGLFSVALYQDATCDGSPDTLLSGPVSVSAGDTLCVVARVQASAGTPQNASLSYGITAATAFTGTSVARLHRNDDRITGSASGGGGGGELSLRKFVRNLTKGTPEGTSNAGDLGDVLQYRIELTNPTAHPAENVTVNDRTPAYTTLAVPITSPVTVAPGVSCTLTTPNTPGYAGAIEWTCPGYFPPGANASVTFQVQIAP